MCSGWGQCGGDERDKGIFIRYKRGTYKYVFSRELPKVFGSEIL
jgi:hypothetical protein